MAGWVDAVNEGLGLDEESKIVFERALNGLAQLRATSLDRFAGYVLRVHDAVEAGGPPWVDALGTGLPALRLPNDRKAFAGAKERSRRHTSAWQREFTTLYRRRRGYMLKESPSQIVLNEDECSNAFAKSRDAIPEEHHAELRSAWDKLIHGKARETTDFLAGIAAAMESFVLQSGSSRKLRIRCDKASKRDLRSFNVDAGEYFALRYAGLQRLLGPDVELDLGHLLASQTG